jgi:K+-transporting ATPase ATPase A chain
MHAYLFTLFIVGGTALLSWPLGRYMKWAMEPTGAGARRLRLDGWFEMLSGPSRPS